MYIYFFKSIITHAHQQVIFRFEVLLYAKEEEEEEHCLTRPEHLRKYGVYTCRIKQISVRPTFFTGWFY